MEKSIYEKLFGLKPIINLCGVWTILGGSIPPPEVVEATVEASKYFVDLRDLLKRAGELVAKLVEVEAAFITSGSAAGITLATAACIVGADPEKISQLPDTEGMKNEVIIQNGHYLYNWMVRLAGAKIVPVGDTYVDVFHEMNNRPEQIENAISEKTCAIFHVISESVPPGTVPLEKVIEIAKKHQIPVILDAADQLPPAYNLKKYIDMGADLAIFSCGKAIQCFNDTGIILGRRDLIDACMMISNPNHAIGRGFKICKEQIVATVVALQRFLSLDFEAERAKERARAEYIIEHVKSIPHVKSAELKYPDETGCDKYRVLIALDEKALGMTTTRVALKLRSDDPQVWTNPLYLPLGKLTIETKLMKDNEQEIFVERMKEILRE